MKALHEWLRDDGNRGAATFVFTVLAALLAGGWAFFNYLHPPPGRVYAEECDWGHLQDHFAFNYPVGTASGVVWVNDAYLLAIVAAVGDTACSSKMESALADLNSARAKAHTQDESRKIIERNSEILAAIARIESLVRK